MHCIELEPEGVLRLVERWVHGRAAGNGNVFAPQPQVM